MQLCDLSKPMDCASPAAFLEMHCVIKYALSTKSLGLKIKPIMNKKVCVMLFILVIAIVQVIQFLEVQVDLFCMY